MQDKKIIALYLRLSKHDEDIEEDMESNSIVNQREILQEYVKKNLDLVSYDVQEFVDDGFSGTSMERPAMQTLLKMAENGRIYAIVVKDLSRFARNYLKSAYYMEKVFPVYGIRFICVNDGYDSDHMAYQLPGLDMAFKGIIHDYYCKELSRKLKIARKQQVEKGKCIYAKPPYGYWKSETDKGVLIVDAITAPIVQEIFSLYLKGSSAYKIAQDLNRRGIRSPNNRLIDAGLISFRNEEYMKGMCWNSRAVLSILRNQVYIGDMVGGKEERLKICDRNCKEKSREEWIIVQGTHEPIINKDIFYQVQRLLAEKTQKRNRKAGISAIFSGKLICGVCYGKMTKSGVHKGVEYYACSRCRSMGRKGVTAHSDWLEKRILDKIIGLPIPKSMMQGLHNSISVSGPNKTDRECEGGKGAGHEKKIRTKLLADYEMYAEGLIDKEEYERRRKELNERTVIRTSPMVEETVEYALEERKKEVFNDESRLTFEIIDYYVDKIIVNGANDAEIEWKESIRQTV